MPDFVETKLKDFSRRHEQAQKNYKMKENKRAVQEHSKFYDYVNDFEKSEKPAAKFVPIDSSEIPHYSNFLLQAPVY